MTLHIRYDHQCAGCDAAYIPYDDVPCPRCGLLEPERFDYIPRAVESMQCNRKSSGSYTPGAWWVSSLADSLLYVLFGLFDRFEQEQPTTSFEQYAANYLHRIDWKNRPYLQEHVHGIALRVREELERRPPTKTPQRRTGLFWDQPAVEVTPYIPDWVRCPSCGKRFSLRNPDSWSGERHLTCGQRLEIREKA